MNGSFLVKPVTGVQRYAHQMLDALSRIGYEKVIILAPPVCIAETLYGYPVIRDPISISWVGQWWLWEQIRLPMLVLEHSNFLLWSPANTGPLAIASQFVTMHDAAVFAGPEWFSRFGGAYYRWLLPRLARRARHVISVSTFSKAELIKFNVVSPDKVTVVYPGVDQQENWDEKDGSRPAGSDLYILNVGSRDPRKNVGMLLSAWTRVNPDLKRGIRLLIIGGAKKGFAKEGINNLPPDVEMLGYVSDEQMSRLYRNAFGFVFPSLYEGFGFPPLEAMSHDCPVVCSQAASLPEACGDAAIYCDPTSADDIAFKLELLLSDSCLRREMINRGRRQVECLGWRKSAEAFLGVLARLTTNGS